MIKFYPVEYSKTLNKDQKMKFPRLLLKWTSVLVVAVSAATSGWVKGEINVYGPGGLALNWNILQVANPELAQVVKMDEPFRIYRDTGVVPTHKGSAMPLAKEFVELLLSSAGRKIFAKSGWITQ